MKFPQNISPPLLNSANPWCTTLSQLQSLYSSPYTGAITTRTSLLGGFPHDSSIHQFTFFDPNTLSSSSPNVDKAGTPSTTGSLNTLGYSPIPLHQYLDFIKQISEKVKVDATASKIQKESRKPIILSITGSVTEVIQCYQQICTAQPSICIPLAMEINLSCPIIPGKPPPAYSSASLLEYLCALKLAVQDWLDGTTSGDNDEDEDTYVPIGIKTPPYTYHDQFQNLVDALMGSVSAEPVHMPCPLDFITAVNTLGSSLLLGPSTESNSPRNGDSSVLKSAAGTGIGGLAGAPLHPLALGNVQTIKTMLGRHEELRRIAIIGVGGIEDVDGYLRMRHVGADAVGVGTALGRKGVSVFEEIGRELEKR